MVPHTTTVRPAEPNELVPVDYFSEIDPGSFFPGDGPLEIDLGCGDGKFTLDMAEEDEFFYPKTDFQIQWEAEGKRLQGLRARKPE